MQDASIVFLGSLTEISPPLAGFVTFGFDVRLVYKGDVGATAQVSTFSTAENCGFGDTARRGEWLVFGFTFPGDESTPPLLSTCSPSGPLATDTALPIELGEGRTPPGAEEYVPVLSGRQADAYYGSVTDPRDTARAIVGAVAVVVGVGIVARLLAGRRRFVVR
jgi:hypothetical protein